MARTISGRMVDITEHIEKCVQEDKEILAEMARLDRLPSLAKAKT
jgi:hypothetical protein